MPRPSFDEWIFDGCVWVAQRATCPRRHVGAILVKDGHIIATGYNGAEAGAPQCDDPTVGCLMIDGHCERTVHAELNTLLQSAKFGIDATGSTMYCTVNPCFRCRMYAKQAGVVGFKWRDSDYVDRAPEISP